MIVDVITFNGEEEIFNMRYNILKDAVDEFRVIEFDKTFSGNEKLYYTAEMIGKWPKVRFYQLSEVVYNKYRDLALLSPNTEYGQGAEHWIREFCQKEAIKDCLTDLMDYDLLFIGDCDEIWNPEYQYIPQLKLNLDVYTYWLNNRSSEEFWGTTVVNYKDIKNECLNHVRTNAPKSTISYGWHFTSIGGPEKVKQKLLDSYTKESYANDWVISNIEANIYTKKDFLGRNFTYTIDESQWPEYLKKNSEKYQNLLL